MMPNANMPTESKQTPGIISSLPDANRDIISSLPNAILCHIMSYLPPKDAAKTRILCRRWKETWFSVPDRRLYFRYHGESITEVNVFVNFVHRVLILRQETIKAFSLRAISHQLSSVLINQWIFAAIDRKVEELDIVLYYCNVQLPQTLFCCKTIKILKLRNIRFQIPESICLPNLNVLHLYHLYNLDDDSMKKLLSSSPVLEELIIVGCDQNNSLHLQSASLKSLKIFFQDREDFDLNDQLPIVDIDAPKLEYLDLKLSKVYKINEMPLLVKAIVDVSDVRNWLFDEDDEFLRIQRIISNRDDRLVRLLRIIPNSDQLIRLLSKISNVKALTLSHNTLESLRWKASTGLPSFHNLTCLEVTIFRNSCSTLPRILRHTPKLEVLILISRGDIWCSFDNDIYAFNENRVPPLSLPFLHRLKRVEFSWFLGTPTEMNMAEYFLKHSTVLETVAVKSSRKYRIEEKEGLLKILNRFPWASSTCQILFS